MSPLPSQEEFLRRKAVEDAEIIRQRERVLEEERGLEEALARYWRLLQEFVDRARELGLHPDTHTATSYAGAGPRVEWVEGFRLTGGSIVTAPPLRYSLQERRFLGGHRSDVHELEELSLFVLATDAGLTAYLSEPRTASQGGWPPVTRWDRAANLLLALEAELEASMLELMRSQLDVESPDPEQLYVARVWDAT
jgi:hypothetical protein